MERIPGAEQLLAACHSQNSERQLEAMPLLAQYYPDVAQSILIELLTSLDAIIRLKSISLLGDLATQNVAMIAPALLNALNDLESSIRSQAVHTLLRLKYPVSKERLLSLLYDDPDWQIRRTIVEAMGYLNEPSFLPELEKSFQKETIPSIRAHAVRSIGLLVEQSKGAILRFANEHLDVTCSFFAYDVNPTYGEILPSFDSYENMIQRAQEEEQSRG